MARGDHIYVNRFNGVYNHHGIDCGDGSAIHYTSKKWQRRRRIERTALADFCRDDELQVRDYAHFQQALAQADEADQFLNRAGTSINRLLDALRGLEVAELDFSEEAVMARAESRLGESSFDLMSNNCEHFAAWCKTGISGSDQINSVWRASLSGPRFLRRRTQHMLTEMFENTWRS
jgi:hypothetical protein